MREKSVPFVHSRWFTVGVAISLSAATFASPIGTSMDQPWHADSNGRNIPIDYSYGIDPNRSANVEAWVTNRPWSGSWWWTKSGSVAVRWRTRLIWSADHTYKDWPTYSQSDSMTYDVYSADQLAAMSEEDIWVKLSAIEKLDVISGHADPRLYNSDPAKNGYYSNLASVRSWVLAIAAKYPEDLGFHGLCHGISHASMWLPEPEAVTIPVEYKLKNGQMKTINVRFGSGDLKALATWYYGQRTFTHSQYQAAFIGENEKGMNPAALHLLLVNLTWNSGQSFVVDTAFGKSVWNYPVAGFKLTTYASGPATGEAAAYAAKEVFVKTTVYFMGTSNPTEDPLGSKADEFLTTRQYNYRLELDANDKIVGGSWASSSDRPDYAWILKGQIPFEGDYALLADYWKAAPRN